MNDNRYPEVGLYYHNADSYDKVKAAYEAGEQVVGIVHATGTGKSFNALQLAFDNKDKKIIYVVPSNGIIDHIKELINSNPNLDMDRDFPNLEFRTYQSFIPLSEDEIESIGCDLLVLDEFHHIGAPVWGARIDTMIETHPDMKIFGMTAYTVRDRGTPYERNMADPDTDELFSNKIASRYDLVDAMVEGVLPIPVYKTAYVSLMLTEKRLEERVLKMKPDSKDYRELMPLLLDVKKRIHEAQSIPTLLQRSLKPDGKYIYFCPPVSEDGTNNIETIKKQATEWFNQIYPGKEVAFYTSTSDMGKEGKRNRDAFYSDVTLEGEDASDKLRVMFAINQYNEGIHAPNIDGVILGRGTCSDIIFFEQIGRALAVRGNTSDKIEELQKFPIEDLIKMCNEKRIPIKDGMSKDSIIERLVSPTIIDLTNNIDFIKDLENRLKDRIKNFNENGLGNSRRILDTDGTIDIELVNANIYELLRYAKDRLIMTWEDKYTLAKAYYEKYGNLLIPDNFKTLNGCDYDENGFKLGRWIVDIRVLYKNDKLDEDKKELLNKIGMIWDVNEEQWMEMYNLAKAYYEKHGNLLIPQSFITLNGYEFDENGKKLGKWINKQRLIYFGKRNVNINDNRVKMLEEIGMVWKVTSRVKWDMMYDLAKAYYEKHGNLLIPNNFKTKNGYDYDEKGKKLGNWIIIQRQSYNGIGNNDINKEQIKLLEEIGMVWEIQTQTNEEKWMEMYNLAKAYYEKHGNLLIHYNFKTKNGYKYDENGVKLGIWIKNQRSKHSENNSDNRSISNEQIKLLEEIGMEWEIKEKTENEKWMKMYNLAKAYYEKCGDLLIPNNFKTKNGYDYDEEGENLGIWIVRQRQNYNGTGNTDIDENRKKLLEEIGMVWDKNNANWHIMYILAKVYYEMHGDLLIPGNFKTKNGYDYDEEGEPLGNWIIIQRKSYKGYSYAPKIDSDRIKLLEEIGMVWDLSKKINDENWMKMYSLARAYYEKHGNLLIPKSFQTKNGYDYDEEGENLGIWIGRQRQSYNGTGDTDIDENRKKLLEEIGMVWTLGKNRGSK